MKIEKMLIRQNFTKGRRKPIQFIVIHDTGNTNTGSNALMHYNYFNTGERQASAHYFVDDSRIIQTVEDTDTAWHGGKSISNVDNDNSIGIEICINRDGNRERAISNAAELATNLLKKYGLKIESLKRHYDVSGKICPRTMSEKNWTLWGTFVSLVRYRLDTGEPVATEDISLTGESVLSVSTLARYLLSRNQTPKIACTVLELATIFIQEGKRENIRGDIAFCQALHETGNFAYGGDVKPEQNNFAGLGATGGVQGNSFATPQEGIRAQIQHLKAYANTELLNAECVDKRFSLVKRGSAPTVLVLAGKWAFPGYPRTKYPSLQEAMTAGETYGHKILAIYKEAKKMEGQAQKIWKDEAREFAIEKKISDGSRPTDAATREEVWAMMKNLYESLKG